MVDKMNPSSFHLVTADKVSSRGFVLDVLELDLLVEVDLGWDASLRLFLFVLQVSIQQSGQLLSDYHAAEPDSLDLECEDGELDDGRPRTETSDAPAKSEAEASHN